MTPARFSLLPSDMWLSAVTMKQSVHKTCTILLSMKYHQFVPKNTPCTKSTEQQTTMIYGEIMTKTNNTDSSPGQSITVMNLILYGIIGGLLFIIVLLLLIIVGCTVCNVRNRKIIIATRGMPSSVSNPYVYDT